MSGIIDTDHFLTYSLEMVFDQKIENDYLE
jgi:hypothetical protein